MRGLWGDGRIAYGAPSRRKKERPKYIKLPSPDGRGNTLKVPFDEYPAVMVFYKMYQAGLLRGLPPDLDISSQWLLTSILDDAKLHAFEKKYPGRLTARFKHVPDSFARLIAKIGYCHLLTSVDLDDFRPICVPYILGQKKNVSFVVGGRFSIPDPDPNRGYLLSTRAFGSLQRLMLIAEIRLLANNHTPKYHVVVGDVIGRAQVEIVVRKLKISDDEISPFEVPNREGQLADAHWNPSVWPLPFWSTAQGELP